MAVQFQETNGRRLCSPYHLQFLDLEANTVCAAGIYTVSRSHALPATI